ncbi:MAG: hypothetical protein PGN13_10180 [Patulibacter minatonensis]
MNRLFELWDRADGQFPHLTYVLAGLPPEAQSWPWHISWLEPVRLRKFGVDVRQYVDAERHTATGWPALWSDLETLATGTLQILEGLIVVPYAGATPPRITDPDLSILSSSAVALGVVDANYWNLWIPDTWVPHVQASFADLREVTPGQGPLTS